MRLFPFSKELLIQNKNFLIKAYMKSTWQKQAKYKKLENIRKSMNWYRKYDLQHDAMKSFL